MDLWPVRRTTRLGAYWNSTRWTDTQLSVRVGFEPGTISTTNTRLTVRVVNVNSSTWSVLLLRSSLQASSFLASVQESIRSCFAHPHIQECRLLTPLAGCATGCRRAGCRLLKRIGVTDPLPVSESESLSTETTGRINGTWRLVLMVFVSWVNEISNLTW